MGLKEDFDAACEAMKQLPLSNEEQLRIYALFKVVKNGDLDESKEPRPGFLYPVDQAKWDERKKIVGKYNKEQAMAEYIKLYNEYKVKYNK
jgi:acyl-CoA-binding protein